ncbi:hypothetical protein ASPSYDRAFT_143131, partial [Aspergillus sydowii CBS 593.65]
CIICLEPFGPDGVKAPDTLSIACQHTPSVCYICLAKSIKHDLEAKFWNEIKCPECKTLFVHEDIKRFADEETFARYNNFSFRAAVSVDKNFVWCLDCPFGQLHESGAEQPLVRCLNCNSESCFKHSIKWHDEFTCDEYDAILWDPDKDDFREKIEMLKRRMREVELSVNLVEEIAKRCPGCQWPIEKNEGCDHMTCKLTFLTSFLVPWRCLLFDLFYGRVPAG